MKTIWVKSLKGRYPVFLGDRLLERTGGLLKRAGFTGKVLVVTQRRVARFHLQVLLRSLHKAGFQAEPYLILDGEEAKSEKELFRLFHTLLEKDFERRDGILALGGGGVGDLAGFAAATYLRGVPFVNVATTLLAQVDSSIGGKTGINLGAGKNLVGAFYPPRLVLSDTDTLKTLPAREFQASLAEVVKYGVIRDRHLFRLLEISRKKILAKDPNLLASLVKACARIKAEVVGRDEFETRGARMILNYGHTFGHAFEQALGYRKLMHGEAVAIGMACAARLAVGLKLFSRQEEQRQWELLVSLRLPVSLAGLRVETDDVLSAMMRDKKKRAGHLRFILPTRIGEVVVREGIPLRQLRRVLEEVNGK